MHAPFHMTYARPNELYSRFLQLYTKAVQLAKLYAFYESDMKCFLPPEASARSAGSHISQFFDLLPFLGHQKIFYKTCMCAALIQLGGLFLFNCFPGFRARWAASVQVNRQIHAWICAHISASDRDPEICAAHHFSHRPN